ncbi:DNA gyrase inhibitor YacG [Albidovulum sp.]|jgi:endogenous inhibitor of DNA gyrase (YacG/DUF329 family)|uniref:DNA gyrase inhibitor YacG n=1 Tax=Albidovulum sp. TaxID=1872424 RepID=UPI0039B9328A
MTCPICGKPADPKYRPFCCKRCADIDLGRWLTGAYAIPAEEEDLPDEADRPDPPPRPH